MSCAKENREVRTHNSFSDFYITRNKEAKTISHKQAAQLLAYLSKASYSVNCYSGGRKNVKFYPTENYRNKPHFVLVSFSFK